MVEDHTAISLTDGQGVTTNSMITVHWTTADGLVITFRNTNTYIITPWSFADAQDIDIRVRVDARIGMSVWLDGVKTDVPAATHGLEFPNYDTFMPSDPARSEPGIPVTLQKYRIVQDALTDAEIEAWT